ncbi:hypothetical protein KIK84_09530 [Curvibacter sp. CHRR-16]|uniref:hypothetical protein n=1 Tax=Curvibacter sp. CHRR-16 TaxID=2835872 RepID=UPI001BD9DD72|nr:hypothetical protein [Curvibacter sp. CHRR-16]MBT0570570.1 hypothetical protein [Curvibacter sp. CHRR-16]
MALDVPGGRKNTAVNHSHYVVFEEMLSNAIDSYLIRRSRLATVPPFKMSVGVKISQADLFDATFNVEISCTDNGVGFGEDEVKAFVTKDSTYKDLLQIPGIGKCKGAGRIQFFHHYERMNIDSVFERDGEIQRRQLQVDDSTRLVSEQSFVTTPAHGSQIETTFTLKGRRPSALTPEQKADESLIPQIFSAKAIADHLYTTFLQRLIILKKLIGNFRIEVESRHGDIPIKEFIDEKKLPDPIGEVAHIPLMCDHGKELRNGSKLSVTRYSFAQEIFPNFQHEVALCANSAVVQQITKRYLRNATARKRPTSGHFELLLVESQLLEDTVNQQRDGFNIPATCTESDTLKDEFSLEDVVNSLEDYVFQIITPPDFDKDVLVRSTEQRFGITRQMMERTNIKIHYGDNEENIARRVLKTLQEEIVGDTSSLFRIKDELLKLDPRSNDFRLKISELAWKYTSSIKTMDMTNLSQLVVRRSAMIEVLDMAVDGLLKCQTPEPGKKNDNERIIHNIFFPRGKDSTDTSEHDIWLLNEEYQYFEYIASDKPLKSIKWSASENVFEPDIDESLEELFARNNKDHEEKRPDIALFTKEGAAIIIEFKAPDVGLQEHIPDLAQYARLLAAKSNGRIKKFYGYLIGCTIDETRMDGDYTQFPDGRGFFKSQQLKNFANSMVYGELYTEVLLYKHFIDRASARLHVYKDKLRVQLN